MTATPEISEQLTSGRAAREGRRWLEAYEAFSRADQLSPLDGDGLLELADAAFWASHLTDEIGILERAYRSFMRDGRLSTAARVAMQLSLRYEEKLADSVVAGWLSRAGTLLADQPESAHHGWHALLRARRAKETGDRETAEGLARQAISYGTQFEDRELWAQGSQLLGWILLELGRPDEGWALVDEATASAMGGELNFDSTARVFCRAISACREVMDLRRAQAWTDAAGNWCSRESVTGFPGVCRIFRAELLRMNGSWSESELEALKATEELTDFSRTDAGLAYVELAEIRLRKGNLAEAEQALDSACQLGALTEPAFSLLQLHSGDSPAAMSSIRRALDSPALSNPERLRLLIPAVEIYLANDEREAASETAEEIERLATAYDSDVFRASALQTRGMVDLAKGEAGIALGTLNESLSLWLRVNAPYEAARVRLLMGQAHAILNEPKLAQRELRAARRAFQELGAKRDERLAGEAIVRIDRTPTKPATRTFLFSDMVSSTQLIEAIGDAQWTEVVTWHDQRLRQAFTEFGGQEVDHAGDGFFVAFPDADSAVSCAVAIQRGLAEHRHAHGFAPQVRIGIHMAEALEYERSFKGRGVHLAARIGAQAGGSEIVASVDTIGACSNAIRTSDHTSVALKGIVGPTQIARIDWASDIHTDYCAADAPAL